MTPRIRNFESFKNELNDEQKYFLDAHTRGNWIFDPKSGLVDVEGDFNFSFTKTKSLRGIKFGRVYGDFSCSYNELRNLTGSPLEVDGDFNCRNNNLSTLSGSPVKVGRSFFCTDNKIKNLIGGPKKVGWNYDCSRNPLTSLEGMPEKIGFGTNRVSFRKADGENQIYIGSSQFNPRGFLNVLSRSEGNNFLLLSTFVNADMINGLIAEDPEQTVIDLAPLWNSPDFLPMRKNIKIPPRYRDEMGLLGDLSNLGF